MNILLFSGFLGSGKTSAILHAARFLVEEEARTVAIIENEIGEVGIDDQTIAAQGLKVTGIFAGCVCCQITGALLSAIDEIHRTLRPDWLIIEATGLADPGNIVSLLTKYSRRFASLCTAVLVDAERWEELYEVVQPLIASQVRAADAILLNKVDLVDDCRAVEEEVRRLNDRAPIHMTNAAAGIPGAVWREVTQ